jgi:hypothetical protein
MFRRNAAAETYSICCCNGKLPLAWVEEEMGQPLPAAVS